MAKDLTGEKFGMLTVLRKSGTKTFPCGQVRNIWECQCECGKIVNVLQDCLTGGNTKSCGCYRKAHPELFRKNNRYDLSHEDYIIGYFSNDGAPFYISPEDYEKAKQYTWTNSRGYGISMIDGKLIRLHRYLIGEENIPEGMVVDHINHNPSDNRRSNLRIITQFHNSRNLVRKKNNTSGRAGVSRCKDGRWRAYINVNRRQIYLGSYEKIEDAIEAREKAELKYYGEYRNLYPEKSGKEIIVPEADCKNGTVENLALSS